MRKFSAHYIFTGNGEILKHGILVTDDDGTIREVIDTGGHMREQAGVAFHSGILVPGFVNTHCHLELSHLKGAFAEKKGLPAFLKQVVANRPASPTEIVDAARHADLAMQRQGIVAVGDVANQDIAFQVKAHSKLHYHTFIEALGFSPERAERAWEHCLAMQQKADALKLRNSIVPHAPYSVSEPLFNHIAQHAATNRPPVSMHNQECADENLLFQKKEGAIAIHLEQNIHASLASFSPTGKNSLASVQQFLKRLNSLILVHNTYTTQEDLDQLFSERGRKNTWFALCPNSNLYLEDRLPDVSLMRENGVQICLGTDSLSSNWDLSMVAELYTLQQHFPQLELMDLVTWATLNGAEALGFDKKLGSFAVGKQPGVNLISGVDLQQMKLTERSRVKPLLQAGT